jgi:catechol 2,3-dioxygenase-like lactoylglutathione lyase family enzyme
VTTGIDEPPPPVTTGINGVDLADRPKSAADPEPAPADPPQNVAATPVPAPDSPKPVRPAPDSATPVSPAPRSRAPLDDVAAPVIPAPRNPAQDLPDQRESQKHTSRLDDIITAYPSARPGPAGAIHGIGLTVLVTDLDRSRRFYRDLLGFHEIDAGDGSAVLASGDTRLVLRRGTAVGTSRPIHLNLEVGDLDAMHAELLGKGVEFAHGPRVVNRGERLELWAAELDDPDGHNIAISQWRAVD